MGLGLFSILPFSLRRSYVPAVAAALKVLGPPNCCFDWFSSLLNSSKSLCHVHASFSAHRSDVTRKQSNSACSLLYPKVAFKSSTHSTLRFRQAPSSCKLLCKTSSACRPVAAQGAPTAYQAICFMADTMTGPAGRWLQPSW